MGKKRMRGKQVKAGWKIIVRDIVLFGIALNVFALFHHVLPRKLNPVETSSYTAVTTAPAQDTLVPATTPASSATPSPEATLVPSDSPTPLPPS